MSTTRERYTWRHGQQRIRVTCSAGHVATWSDQGLGRASAAAWETRHVGCDESTAKADEAVRVDMASRWRNEG